MKQKVIAQAVTALCLSAMAVGAQAQKVSDDVVKIGVLTDLSGAYSDLSGQGSVVAARMAIEDFSKSKTVLGKKIELISADHQNKADIAANKAREWYDKDGVVFGNRERLLPPEKRGFYREYTVKTPGERSRGARRIVCGGEEPRLPKQCFYTQDHYTSFREIVMTP